MFKFISNLATFFVLLLCCQSFAFKYDESVKSVGKIYSDKHSERPCSGVLIHNQIVLTALHCVGDESGFHTNMYFEDLEGKKSQVAKLIYPEMPKTIKEIWQDNSSYTKDFAFLILQSPTNNEYTRIDFNITNTLNANKLISFGYPYLEGIEPMLFSSQCDPLMNHLATSQTYVIVRCLMLGGMSGGGVFVQTSKGYSLIGVNQSGVTSRTKGTMGGFIKIQDNPLFKNYYNIALSELKLRK